MGVFNVTVVGNINHDIIVSSEGKTTDSLGGIVYNIVTLAEVGGSFIKIFPVSFIGRDEKRKFDKLIAPYPNVLITGVVEISEGTNINYLRYTNCNEREELTQFFTGEITYEMIEKFLDVDVVHFNFISGYDVALDTIVKVREKTDALIFLDVHSLVLKKETTQRHYRCVAQWKDWIKGVDIIQMNITELFYFTCNPINVRENDIDEIKSIIKMLLEEGIKIVIVTVGEKGVYLGYKEKVYFFRQKYRYATRDTTGCGDIFSSAFLTKYLATHDAFISVEYANLISGVATTRRGIKKCYTARTFRMNYIISGS